MQLPSAGTLEHVFPVSVTFPSRAVPVKLEVTFVAATINDVLLIVSVPVGPLVVRVNGEFVTVIVAVVIAGACVICKILA